MTNIQRPPDNWLPIDVDETDYVGFDFTDMLASGESVASVAVTCEVVAGTDNSPATRLSGGALVAGAVVKQAVTTGQTGVTYLIRCVATLAPGPRRLVLGGLLPVLKVGA